METDQTVDSAIASNGHSRITSSGRGRARSRLKKHTEDTRLGVGYNAADNPENTEPSSSVKKTETIPGQFEDLTPNKNCSFLNTHRHTPGSKASVERGTTSDKENSCSPTLQRSRKSVFDSGVMSQINSHLRKGINERSDGNSTRSLDRSKKEASPLKNARQPRSNLHIDIPTDKFTSCAQYAAAFRKLKLAEGRPRSMTDPTPPSTSEDTGKAVHETVASSAGLLCVKQSAESDVTTSTVTVPTPAAEVKVKGRGRGRARGRGRVKDPGHNQSDMESAVRPGAVSETSSGHVPSRSEQSQHFENGQFSDVMDTIDSHSHSDCRSSAECSESKPQPSAAAHSDLTPQSVGEDDSATVGRHNKGLTLKIGSEEQGKADDSAYSPIPDDITLLLSPDHEYTLDWAAAMATPTPDTSTDSPPDWNV